MPDGYAARPPPTMLKKEEKKERPASCGPLVGTVHLIGGYMAPPKFSLDCPYCKVGTMVAAVFTSPHSVKWIDPSCNVRGQAAEVKREIYKIETHRTECTGRKYKLDG